MTDNHMFGSTEDHDSAGQPWAGRTFASNNFSDDDGSASPAFIEAVAAFRGAELWSDDKAHALRKAVDTVRATRFLIPLIAEAGDLGTNKDGLVVDKTQELSVVLVEGPDNSKALPAFSSVAAMQAWRADARPIPIPGIQLAAAAIEDGVDMIVIDPAQNSELTIRARAFEAIADQRIWIPPQLDGELIRIFSAPGQNEPYVRGIRLMPGDPDARGMGSELIVEVSMVPGLEQDDVQRVVGRMAELWSDQQVIAEKVSSLLVNVVSAQ